MTILRDRLIRCFSAVFPTIPGEAIPTASIESLKEWDSLNAVTLITVLEEEFGIRINIRDLTSLSSFKTIENYLLKRDDIS